MAEKDVWLNTFAKSETLNCIEKHLPALTLSLDIGSSSVRAALFDGDAQLIRGTLVKSAWSFTAGPDGGSEMRTGDAIDHVAAVIDQALEKSAKIKGEIAFVASCSFWHSLVGIDERGKHTPVVLGWADTRSRAFTAELRDSFDEVAVHNRTGATFHSSFWPAKLMWLRSEFAEAFSHASHFLSFTDLLGLRFFGEIATSVSMASATGIFDIRKCEWDRDLLRFLKVKPVMLPPIAKDGETFKLNKKFAKRWPRLANAAWFPPIGDGAADHVGSCGIGRNAASLMVGTSAAMRVAYAGEPPVKIPDGLWCYRIDRKRVIVGGALSDGGNLYGLIKKRFGLGKNADKLLAKRPPADDLVVIPFFHGERSTGYDENARGAIIGLTAAHDGIDVLRAALEGVAFRLQDIFERLSEVVDVREIVASGGALKASPVWTHIIADVLGRDLALNDSSESSIRGAVLLAFESLGKIDGIEG